MKTPVCLKNFIFLQIVCCSVKLIIYMLEKWDAPEEIIVCLYDGKYHFGLAALVNSLVRSNFKGLINTAYRDGLPPG